MECPSEVPKECWSVEGYSLLVSHQHIQLYTLHASVHQVYKFDGICDTWTIPDILRNYKQGMMVVFCKFNFEGKKDPVCHICVNKVHGNQKKED